MRALLFTLMWMCSIAAAATVYRWVDENGVVHFSDQPHENAEKVPLKAPQTYAAPKTPKVPVQSTTPQKSAPVYQSCGFSEPSQDQMYMNAYTVTAGVTAQPAVRPGDTAIVTLDGQQLPGVPPNGGRFSISPIDRGTHSLQLTIKDPTGATVCSSASVTFHVNQPSLQSPTRPVKPR